VVDDPGEFVGRGGHGFGSTEIPHPLRLHKQLDVT